MEDLDPLKQLQSFIDDRGKVLEKISGIQSTLKAIKWAGLAAGQSEQPPKTDPAGETETPLNPDNRSYDSLLKALRDMQAQIEQRVRPLAQEALHAEEARLRKRYSREHKSLDECLARIDQCLLNCRDRIDEYEKRRAELARLNQRLSTLGADPLSLPESPAVEQDLAAIIMNRFGILKQQGKL